MLIGQALFAYIFELDDVNYVIMVTFWSLLFINIWYNCDFNFGQVFCICILALFVYNVHL